MNWDIVEGNWVQFKAAARTKWGKITDSDWDQIGGKMSRLEGIMQERYGIKKDQLAKEVDEMVSKWKPNKKAAKTH